MAEVNARGNCPNAGRVVVIGVDRSQWSERAFDWYIENVHRPDDHVIVVHVDEPVHLPALPHAMATPEFHEHVERHEKKVTELNKKYAEKASALKLHSKVLLNHDSNVGHSICKTVKEQNGTMIVIGSRGAGVVRRTILGSVSDYVIHHSHVPVLVCPKPHTHHSPFHSPIFGRKCSPKGSPKGSPRTSLRHEQLKEDA